MAPTFAKEADAIVFARFLILIELRLGQAARARGLGMDGVMLVCGRGREVSWTVMRGWQVGGKI